MGKEKQLNSEHRTKNRPHCETIISDIVLTSRRRSSWSPVFFITIIHCFLFVNCAVPQRSELTPTTVVTAKAFNESDRESKNLLLHSNFPRSIINIASELQPTYRQLQNSDELHITGLRVESSKMELGDGGIPIVLSDAEFSLRIFGKGITEDTKVAFTTSKNAYGGACQTPSTPIFKPMADSVESNTALLKVTLPKGTDTYYICAKNDKNENIQNVENVRPLVHQGSEIYFALGTYEPLLPLWTTVMIILMCLTLSALFSGLNLGLMALDRTELKILCNTGSAKEREYAKTIEPVREKGNFLLCSILLGNVLVNSTFTILLDGLTSGVIAVACSTFAIVILGEITPQAICSRHGLKIGAKTIWLTKTVMLLTFPLAYPMSKLLDLLLGEEIGNVYNRERLKELVKVTTGINDLDRNEVNIISGALELHKKTVADIMTHIDDAFMLSLDAVLDFDTVSEIMKSGFSRIPVYDGNTSNIVTLLYIKDLAFVDTDDNMPLKTLCEFYQNPVHFVFEDITLDIMFNQFKGGTIGHLAFVHRINNEGDGDPYYETIGLVTLEDVIEELIQAEIVDETDVYTDNRSKTRRSRNKKPDFRIFSERRDNQSVHISPQLALATYQYLSTAVSPFKKEEISEAIMRRLLNQDIVQNIKCKGKDKDDPELFIYQQGEPADYFVLILEGRVEVTVGQENLIFESGQFSYFGIQALNPIIDSPVQPTSLRSSVQSLKNDPKVHRTFKPDYSVRAVSDVLYMVIKRNLYLTAKKATLLEKSRKTGSVSGEMDDELEKLLYSYNESSKDQISDHSVQRDDVSQSLNDISQHSRNRRMRNSHSSLSGTSFTSQLQGDQQIEMQVITSHHKENGETTTPLLPKPKEDQT